MERRFRCDVCEKRLPHGDRVDLPFTMDPDAHPDPVCWPCWAEHPARQQHGARIVDEFAEDLREEEWGAEIVRIAAGGVFLSFGDEPPDPSTVASIVSVPSATGATAAWDPPERGSDPLIEDWTALEGARPEDYHPVELAALQELRHAVAAIVPTYDAALARVDWAALRARYETKRLEQEKEESARAESEHDQEQQVERQGTEREVQHAKTIAFAERARRDGLACPHCHVTNHELRVVQHHDSALVCPSCGRSFYVVPSLPSPMASVSTCEACRRGFWFPRERVPFGIVGEIAGFGRNLCWPCFADHPERLPMVQSLLDSLCDQEKVNPAFALVLRSPAGVVLADFESLEPEPENIVRLVSVPAATGCAFESLPPRRHRRPPIPDWTTKLADPVRFTPGMPCGRQHSKVHPLEREGLAALRRDLLDVAPTFEAALARIDWKAKREVAARAQRILEEEHRQRAEAAEREELARAEHEARTMEIVARARVEGIECPRCHTTTKEPRVSPGRYTKLVCPACARSFDAVPPPSDRGA